MLPRSLPPAFVPQSPDDGGRHHDQAGFHQYLFAVQRIDAAVVQLRVRQDSVNEYARRRGVSEVMKTLPDTPSQLDAIREVTTTITNR
jgi:hypothetical protein